MNFDLKRPCAECPFRSDKPAFFHNAERVREILGDPNGRQWWPASSFPCHKTINDVPIPPTAQQCAGVMIILVREGRYNDAMQIGERLHMFDARRLDMDAPVYLSTDAAIKANE